MPEILSKYSPELSSHEKYKEWNAKQFEEIIENVSVYFPELNGRKILVYFTHHYGIVDNAMATMFPLRYPYSKVSEYVDLWAECRLDKNLDFAIYIRPEIFDYDKDDIAIIVNISHEFQHLSQYVKDKKVYLFGCILHYYLNGIVPEVRRPIEYDAERKSKILVNAIFGSIKVDKWIDSYAQKTSNIFFNIFRDIDANAYYDLGVEVFRLWKEYEIEDEIKSLSAHEKRDDDEESIVEMYNYAISKNSD